MAIKTLIIINDTPFGTEKAYNTHRLAIQFGKDYKDKLHTQPSYHFGAIGRKLL